MTCITRVNAQIVNIENRRIYDDTLGLSGAIDASFSVNKNKQTFLSTAFRPKVQYKTRNHYLLFITDWYYTKGTTVLYANYGMAHLRYAYRLGDKQRSTKSPWKWESYSQLQYNQLLDQRARFQLGSGLRIKAIDKPGLRVFAGTSIMRDYEEIRSSALTSTCYRNNTYIAWYFSKKSSYSFSGTTYFQPAISIRGDYQFMGQYSLSFNIFKRVDFNIELNAFYDSKPATGVENWMYYSSMGTRIRLAQ